MLKYFELVQNNVKCKSSLCPAGHLHTIVILIGSFSRVLSIENQKASLIRIALREVIFLKCLHAVQTQIFKTICFLFCLSSTTYYRVELSSIEKSLYFLLKFPCTVLVFICYNPVFLNKDHSLVLSISVYPQPWRERELKRTRSYFDKTACNSCKLTFFTILLVCKKTFSNRVLFFLMHKHCCFALSTYLKICRTLNKTAVIWSQRSTGKDYLRLPLA
jgi:hypothetical protein